MQTLENRRLVRNRMVDEEKRVEKMESEALGLINMSANV